MKDIIKKIAAIIMDPRASLSKAEELMQVAGFSQVGQNGFQLE